MSSIEQERVQTIQRLHDEFCVHGRKTLAAGIEIGRLLVAQKQTLQHGQFGPWIKANCPFSRMTASKFMKMFRCRKELKSKGPLLLTHAYEEHLRKPRVVGTLDVHNIDPNPFFDMAYLHPALVAWRVNALQELGPYRVLVVRQVGSRYQNVCDHDWYYAAHKLGLKDVPVSIISLDDAQMKKAVVEFDHHDVSEEMRQLLADEDEDA